MFCPNCGTEQNDNAKFCRACGASADARAVMDGGGYNGDDLVGWSPHFDHPAFRFEARAYNRRMIITGLAAFVVFVLALGAYGWFDHGGENFYPLLGVGCALGIFSIVWCFRIALRRKAAPTWGGRVTEKKVVKKRRKKYGGAYTSGTDRFEWQRYTVYQVVIQKDDGD
jgi:hypothetical protein